MVLTTTEWLLAAISLPSILRISEERQRSDRTSISRNPVYNCTAWRQLVVSDSAPLPAQSEPIEPRSGGGLLAKADVTPDFLEEPLGLS